MRKNLYWLSAIAVLASCSDDMIETASVKRAENAQGIQFHVVDPATRGKVDTDYSSFFFAEYDRVGIYADNVADWPCNDVTGFTKEYIYKATRSHGNPFLSGIDYSNVLEFYPVYIGSFPNPLDKEARFFITYPTGQAVAYDAAKKQFSVTPSSDLAQQYMNENYMNFNARLLYQYTTFDQSQVEKAGDHYYTSTGEAIDVDLHSPLYMLRFNIEDIEDYSSLFGDINQVVLKGKNPLTYLTNNSSYTVGADDVVAISGTNYVKSTVKATPVYPALTADDLVEIPKDGGVFYIKSTCKLVDGVYVLATTSVEANVGDPNEAVAPSSYTYSLYGDSKPTHDIAADPGKVIDALMDKEAAFEVKTDNTMAYVPAKNVTNGIDTEVKLIVSSTELDNNTEMNMFVLPVKRNGVKENLTVTYKFDKVQLTYEHPVTADFNPEMTGRLKLNVAQKFPYIVTLGTKGVERSLIVNSGNFAGVLTDAKSAVKWTDEYDLDGTVEFGDVENILINTNVANLTDADWNALQKFTAAKTLVIKNGTTEVVNVKSMAALQELTVENATSVKKNAFNATNGSTIKKLILPKVTNWKDTNAFSALTDLNLGSYTFIVEGEDAAPLFFNNNTKLTLVNVDIHSCPSLAPVFGFERKILFTKYEKLTTIKLNAVETILSADEFSGCKSLNKVEGVCNIESAENAFKGCTALTTVNINGTEIPAGVFASSKVKNVLYNGAQVAPTYVGESAFEGNTAIQVMDLTALTGKSLKAKAFKGASAFKGTDAATNVVTLFVTEVPTKAFDGTIIERFQLMVATSTMASSLNSKALKQIKYRTDLGDGSGIDVDNQCADKKASVDIFVKTQENRDIFLSKGYATVTKEDKDW